MSENKTKPKPKPKDKKAKGKSDEAKKELKKGSVIGRTRFKIEPRRFQRMLENILTYRKTYALDAVGGIFTQDGALFADMQLEVSGYAVVFNKSFFIEFECPQPMLVPFSKSVAYIMKTYFTNTDEVEVLIEGNQIIVSGGGEEYKEDLTDVSSLLKPLPFHAIVNLDDLGAFNLETAKGLFDLNISSCKEGDVQEFLYADSKDGKASFLLGKGIVPEKLKAKIIFSVDTSEVNFNQADLYRILGDSETGTISVVVEGVGRYTKELSVKRTEKIIGLDAVFSGDSWLDAVVQFNDEIWVTIRDDAVVFHQKSKDRCLSYFVSSN